MCIIAVVPEGLHLQDEVINNMWSANSDGAGFMYAEGGKLHIQKGFMTLPAFKEAYEPHAGKKLVLHFRIKTHGETNAVNTHPFAIDDTLAFVHNGIVSGYGSKEFSDTYHLNEELLKPLRSSVKNFLHIKPIEELIQEHVGYSKLVFLDNEGNTTIINESKGETSSDGIWFSNSSWKPRYNYRNGSYQQSNSMHQQDDDDDPVGNQKKTSSAKDKNGNCSDNQCSNESPKRYSATSEYFRCNDSVFLDCPGDTFKGVAKYSVGTVSWFTSGYAIAVKFGNKTEYIPASYLEKIIPIEMIRPIGHIKTGDFLVYKRQNKEGKLTEVIDFERKKSYWIPNDSYKEVDTMKTNSYNYPWADIEEYEYCG